MDRRTRGTLMLVGAMMCAAGTIGCSRSDFAGYTAIKTSDDDAEATRQPDDGGALSASSERNSVDASSVDTETTKSVEQRPDEQPTPLIADSGTATAVMDRAPAVAATSQASSTDPQPVTAEQQVPTLPRAPQIGTGTSVVPAGNAVTAAGSAVMTVTALPGGVRLLIPDQTFAVEGPEGAQRVSFDDFDLLKVLNMEPVPVDAAQHFPDWLKALDGRRIRVRGFMYPPYEETGIQMFLLARDNQICCFGRNPKIYDIIPVTLRRVIRHTTFRTVHLMSSAPFTFNRTTTPANFTSCI